MPARKRKSAGQVEQLRAAAGDLGRALKELRSFLRRASRLAACRGLEELLAVSDDLLLEAVDFVYYRLYLDAALACGQGLPGPVEGGMRLARGACPEDVRVDWNLVAWALSSREVTLLPSPEAGGGVQSLLVVPLVGQQGALGAALLWVDFDERRFTEHIADLLGVYGRSLSAALESLESAAQRERAQALVQKVLESVPLGIFSLSPRGTLTFINGTAEFMLGRPRSEVLNLEYARAFRPEVADCIRRLAGRLERAEDPGEEELEIGGEGERRYALGVSASRLSLPGGSGEAGCVFVVRDLEVTREVARLREIDTMKDDLLSLVSHELRTPLASIMAYAEALLMEGMVESDQERREYLEVIRTEGERLARLVNDVLDLTKMQAGKMDYHFTEQDLGAILEHAVGLQQPLAARKKVRLKLRPPAGLPAVRLDRDRIIQVLCNLLSNAIKYTDEGGEVAVAAEHGPAAEGEPACVQVRVADTGIGIPPEQVHKVWSRFEQVENVRHHTGGTGLGMPICREIIEQGHGGRIWLESQVGKGTTVFLTLPL